MFSAPQGATDLLGLALAYRGIAVLPEAWFNTKICKPTNQSETAGGNAVSSSVDRVPVMLLISTDT